MIKYFAVENFRSIKEENIVEFDAGLPKDSPYVANSTIGIAGANASGKSSLLQALTFTLWFMQDSFLSQGEDELIPTEAFITCRNLPSKFHLIFSHEILVDDKYKNVDIEYILWVTKEEVIKEELLSYPYSRKRLIYRRDKNNITQGSTVHKLDSEVWSNLRENCSIVSFAAQFSSQNIAKICKGYDLISNLTYRGMVEYEFHTAMLESLIDEHGFSKEQIIKLLKIADLGIDDFEVIEIIEEAQKKIYDFIESIGEEITDTIKANIRKIEDKSIDAIKNLKIKLDDSGRNKRKNQKSVYKSFVFKHKIEEYSEDFGYISECSGTLQFFALLYQVMLTLKQGGLFILDEIEIKLHQNLVAYIIGLFQNKYENPHGAQLIFSFHNTYFMEILEPSQLWFTEKNDRGYTEIFSAADFKDIKKLQQRSLEELYRLGRFGAKPRGI